MTIGGWIVFIFITVIIAFITIGIIGTADLEKMGTAIAVIIGIVLIIGLFAGMRWYYSNTASGIRAFTDQKAELSNGLDRTINIYTANGDLIASYKGRIDLEDNSGGYVLFDYEGKRYTYYNCFVESIAEIN